MTLVQYVERNRWARLLVFSLLSALLVTLCLTAINLRPLFHRLYSRFRTPREGTYRTATITNDASGIRVAVAGSVAAGNPKNASATLNHFFFRYETNQGLIILDEYRRLPGRPIENLNRFLLDRSGYLVQRSKLQLLYGAWPNSVVAASAFQYGKQRASATEFEVISPGGPGYEIPDIGGHAQAGGRVLCAISLIRVGPASRIGIVNLNPKGHFESLHLYDSTYYQDRPREREKLALPDHLDTKKYLEHGLPMPELRPQSGSTLVVNLHYDRNSVVRQEILNANGTHEMRILHFKITDADRALDTVDKRCLPNRSRD